MRQIRIASDQRRRKHGKKNCYSHLLSLALDQRRGSVLRLLKPLAYVSPVITVLLICNRQRRNSRLSQYRIPGYLGTRSTLILVQISETLSSQNFVGTRVNVS